MVFEAVHERDCVQNEVVVQVIGMIQMCGHDHLIAVAPESLRQLHADFVGDLRCGLAGGEALIPMIRHGAVLFAVLLLYGQHLLAGGAGVAVDTGYEALQHLVAFGLRFLIIDRVLDHIT